MTLIRADRLSATQKRGLYGIRQIVQLALVAWLSVFTITAIYRVGLCESRMHMLCGEVTKAHDGEARIQRNTCWEHRAIRHKEVL